MYVTADQLNKILSGDAQELNKVLEDTIIKATENTLRAIPVMLGKLFQVTSVTTALVQKVYEENPEFQDYKEVVVMTIHELDGQNPGLDYTEVVKKAVPIIKQKIADYSKIANQIVETPTVASMEKRLNGEI